MTKVEKMTNVKKNGQIGQVFFSFLPSKRGGKRGGRPFAKTPFMFDFFAVVFLIPKRRKAKLITSHFLYIDILVRKVLSQPPLLRQKSFVADFSILLLNFFICISKVPE